MKGISVTRTRVRGVSVGIFLFSAALALQSCSKSSEPAKQEIVTGFSQKTVPAPKLNNNTLSGSVARLLPRSNVSSGDTAVITEITLKKSAILGREFLYGSSLQFGLIKEEDAEEKAPLMAIALGQTPAEFRIVDKKLRLVTDSRIQYESDVNHPARLIHEFPIIAQAGDFITVRADKASPVLSTLLSDKPPATLASWIRTMKYEGNDELFLIESSIETADGSIAEFMETITPRERIVPPGAEPLYNDAELEPLAKRYRFLSSGEPFVDHPEAGRVQTKIAERFVVPEGKVIRWWVTENVPDEFLGDVKNGVEGWNRYSQAMWKRDLVKFEGKLPADVKVGDPRYNVIVWDKVQEAGSAYESQSSDPLTGVQSHSLIYLPLAWVNIGRDYWNNANFGDAAEKANEELSARLARKKFLGRKIPVHCVDHPEMHVTLNSKLDPQTFGRELLKAVLLHEIGHALGLAHNFKGSLAFDPDNLETGHAFSTSIMDYNHYNEELGAFDGLESANGPLLEYDRQILSVLYNKGQDVKGSDPVLGACDDADADSKEGGVDPLCLRYDIGKNPVLQAHRALDLLGNPDARSGRMQSLPKALLGTLEDLPEASEIDSQQKLDEAVQKLILSIRGVSTVYIGATANSLGYLSAQAMKSLYVYRDQVLEPGYNEDQLKTDAYSLLGRVLALDAFPAAAKTSITEVRTGLEAWLKETPVLASVADDSRAGAIANYLKALDANNAATEHSVLSRGRTRVAAALAYSDKAPFGIHTINGQSVDLEAVALAQLEKVLTSVTNGKDRPLAERTAAAKSLASFSATESGKPVIERVKSKLTEEARQSRNPRAREEVRSLLKTLP